MNTLIFVLLAIDFTLFLWWNLLANHHINTTKNLYWQNIAGIIFINLVFIFIGFQLLRVLFQ